MHWKKPIRAALALAALALALPASASAVPVLTQVLAKTGDPGVTFLTDPTGASLTSTQTQYVVSTDGYVVGFTEDNGVTGSGVLDYSQLPSDYRAPMTAEQKRTYAGAQTGVQAHATCAGVAALSDGATILAWQRNAGNDPYYDYVPWQKTSAGLGDDPRTWLPVVRSATGIDLSALSTAADFRAACERLGGTYHPADTATVLDAAQVAAALLPLQAQIASLQRTNASLQRARDASDRAAATARAAQAAAEAAYQALFTKPIALTLASKRFPAGSGVVMITGSPTDPVDVTLEITRKLARRLKLGTTVLADSEGVLNDDGGALLVLKPDAGVLAKLKQWWTRHPKGTAPLAASVHAVSGGNDASTKVKLTR